MKNFITKSIRRTGTSTTVTVPAGVKALKVSFVEKFTNANKSFYPTIALDEFGRVWSWGENGNGQVGDGTVTDRVSPVMLTDQIWKAPFLRTDGQMVNMGSNVYGQLGDNTVVPKSTPTLVSGGHVFKKIHRGSTCLGLTEGGELYVWGRNNHGQHGDGTIVDKSTPTLVMSGTLFTDFWTDTGTNEISGISQPNTIWAKDTDNQTWAWGRDFNGAGVLGTGASGSSSTPTLVSGGQNFVKIASGVVPGGGTHALGLTKTGQLYAWGYNNIGQLGDNTIISKSTPTLVAGALSYRDVFSGQDHSLALTRDGAVYAWGNNGFGQLGQGNVLPKSSPVVVLGLTSGAKQIAAAMYSNYALDKVGKLYAWGFQDATNPLLGSGDTLKKSSPTLVSTLGTHGIVEEIVEDLNNLFVEVVTKQGVRYAWGVNGGGSGNMGVNSAAASFTTMQLVLTGVPAWSQITIPGNIHHRKPIEKRETFQFDVTPGQTIVVNKQESCFAIPEFNLESSRFCEQVDFEWLG